MEANKIIKKRCRRITANIFKPGVRAACRPASSALGVVGSPVNRSSIPGLNMFHRWQTL
jgi:hypothetical protein